MVILFVYFANKIGALMPTTEIEAIKSIDDALSSLDQATIDRILKWALDKYSSMADITNKNLIEALDGTSQDSSTVNNLEKELPGIAKILNDGTFQLTVRDLKAKNTNDAAIRLVHVILFAYEKLTGDTAVSSRHIITPLLKLWRAYTGNTRGAIYKHKGILKSGDKISLDAHSKKEAEIYINEILDKDIKGNWKP